MSLIDHYDDIANCNRCGFCQVACPIFRATGHESGVARGRLALLRALIEGRIQWTRELEESLFNCLRCGACTSNCFPGVATADLLAGARSEYLDKVGRSPLHRLLFGQLLPHPARLRLAARAAALGKRSGLPRAVRALGLLRGFGSLVRDLPQAEGIVDRFPPRAFRDADHPPVYEGTGQTLRIGYFVGCGIDIMCPEAANATLGVLRQVGTTVRVLDNCCCGLPANTYGDRQAERKLIETNLASHDLDALDVIVTDCSSCAAFLKKYPELVAPTDPLHGKATQFASRVRDLVQVLAADSPSPGRGAGNSTHSDVWNWTQATAGGETGVPLDRPVIATYHDPCHAVRSQQLVNEPRQLLRNLSGIEYRELPEADWCCGGAGTYALSHYELSMQVLDRKMDNVEKTGANLLVTSCPACIIQLSCGVRRRRLPIRVCHLSQVAAEVVAGVL